MANLTFKRAFAFAASLLTAQTAYALPLIDIERTLDIPSRTADAVEQKVLNDIEKRIEDNIQDSVQTLTTNQPPLAIDTQTKALSNADISIAVNSPIAALPARLAINNRAGTRHFYDISLKNTQRIIEHEWVIIHDSPSTLSTSSIIANGQIKIIENTSLPALGTQYTRVRVAAPHDTANAVRRLLQLAENTIVQRNFIFSRSAQTAGAATNTPSANNTLKTCKNPLAVGLLDSAINTAHPAFKSTHIVQKSFVEQGLIEPQQHGTAVASILVSQHKQNQQARPLYSASVFYQQTTNQDKATLEHQGATTTSLAQGINWLLQQPIHILNISLTGPANPLLAFALNKVTANNILVVAAVGNNGPTSPPLYPAAYSNVIAVTATDQRHKIYRWAVQGDHIDIAALGINVSVANSQGGYRYDSGTSFAAPVVTDFLSCLLSEKNTTTNTQALFEKFSLDLGLAGKDRIFGWGALRYNPASH